jgi:hypothetical protein
LSASRRRIAFRDDGARLDERVGGRFALLAGDAFRAALPHAVRHAAARGGVHIVEHPSRGISAWLAKQDVPSVLLRPDAYIYAVPRSAADVGAALEHLDRTLKSAVPFAISTTPPGGAPCPNPGPEPGSIAEPSLQPQAP